MHSIFLLIFFARSSMEQAPSTVPLTNALTAIYCHNLQETGIMTIRCPANEKIRMLDAFEVIVKDKSRLPPVCATDQHASLKFIDDFNDADCKVPTSFTSACSGRENCTVHLQRIRLSSEENRCQDEWVDYTIASYECISDLFIHDVCSPQAITSAWGTLQTPNFPNPYTSSDDCWCKLSTHVQNRLFLSVIVFQLIPYDQQCAGAGLYLQSSSEQRSTQCTYLQQGHNYLSDTNVLYVNFYSRTSTVRGGFWIVYEANRHDADVHLQCGSREKLGVPLRGTSVFSPPVPLSYNHGWNHLVLNNPPRSTMKRTLAHTSTAITTPRSAPHTSAVTDRAPADGAFTYPYGHLNTFELAYGPRGWFVKFPFGTSNTTAWTFLQTTTTALPVVKWNSTWRYTRRFRTRIFPSFFTTRKTIMTTMTTTIRTTTTTIPSTTATSTMVTTSQVRITTESSTPPATAMKNTATASIQTVTPQPGLLTIVEKKSDVSSAPALVKSAAKSIPPFSVSLSPMETTLPSPTPWYPPAGPFDWWHWKGYSTKFKVVSLEMLTTTQTSTSSTMTSTTTTTAAPTTTSTTATSTKSTSKATVLLSNTTNSSTITSGQGMTADWFKWPNTEPVRETKDPLDYFDEEYPDELPGVRTSPIRLDNTLPTTSSTSTASREQPLYPELGAFPTRSHWRFTGRMATLRALVPSRRFQPSGSPAAIHGNGMTTPAYVADIIRDRIGQKSRKSNDDHELLGQTDMTIVVVSILFIILLAIVNLILFAMRRHRHRLRSRHLLSSSFPSLMNERRADTNHHHSGNGVLSDSSDHLTDATLNNNNNNDILPAVGEIVLWDEKDQGGYMIDNDGEWAKIDGHQWFRNQLRKSRSKTSFTKSFRSRFRFLRQSEKKLQAHRQAIASKAQEKSVKLPSRVDSTNLSPVPEADDYHLPVISGGHLMRPRSGKDNPQTTAPSSTSRTLQIRTSELEEQSDDYYKRIEMSSDALNHMAMQSSGPGEYSLVDDETDRSVGNEMHTGGSVIVTVPTMFRREEDAGMTTDAAESIYNQNYSIQSIIEQRTHTNGPQQHSSDSSAARLASHVPKPCVNHSMIVGRCQVEFQPLDPTLLMKSNKKCSFLDHPEFDHGSSFQLSSYDSGFVDDSNMDSMATNTTALVYPEPEANLLTKAHRSQSNREPIFSHTSDHEDGADDFIFKRSNRINPRRVSFQEPHQVCSSSSFRPVKNAETSPDLFDTYDMSPEPSVPTLTTFAHPQPSSCSHPARSSANRCTSGQTTLPFDLHSVGTLTNFFEIQMGAQSGMAVTNTDRATTESDPRSDRSSTSRETEFVDEMKQRQKLMNQVLESLKKKRVYFGANEDAAESIDHSSCMIPSSYDVSHLSNSSRQQHYSHRVRSSSTSNQAAGSDGNSTVVTHIHSSNDLQAYNTTNHGVNPLEKGKQHSRRSDIAHPSSNNVNTGHGQTNLNQWMACQQSSDSTSCTKRNLPLNELYTLHPTNSAMVETRF